MKKRHNIQVKTLKGNSIWISFLEFKQYGFIFTHLQLAKYKTYYLPQTFLYPIIDNMYLSGYYFCHIFSLAKHESIRYFVYFILFESLYVCTKLFFMVNKTIWEAYTGIANTIEFPPIKFPQELKTKVYIWLNFLIDDKSWRVELKN